MALKLAAGFRRRLRRAWVGKGHVASPTVCKTAAKALGVRLPPGPPHPDFECRNQSRVLGFTETRSTPSRSSNWAIFGSYALGLARAARRHFTRTHALGSTVISDHGA